MRIPEASANAGGYYEEGAPWQNGVVMDGAGAAGDAHAPHAYPQRQPHVPQPGFMVPPGGAFYPGYGAAPAAPPDDFSDYMWMENEEEFDKQVMQQLEEEALMEQCIEAMLEDERERLNGSAVPSNGVSSISLEEQVSKSKLNPLAAEFVPTRSAADLDAKPVDKTEPVEVSANDNLSEIKQKTPETSAQTGTTEQKEIEVKSDKAIVNQDSKNDDKPPKTDSKKTEPKKEKSKADKPKSEVKSVKSEMKPVKSEIKPVKSEEKSIKSEVKPVKNEVKPVKNEVKPVKSDVKPVKSEAKVKDVKPEVKEVKPAKTKSDVKIAPKKEAKKEAKPSEVKPEEKERRGSDTPVVPAAITAKIQPAVPAEPQPPAAVSGVPKPINYAAAARANKPRKPTDQ